MAKQAKALAGGAAAFGTFGEWTPNVCGAIRMATEKYAATVSKIRNIEDDQKAGLKEMDKLKKGSDESLKRGEQIARGLIQLKLLRAERTRIGSLVPLIVTRADKGDFDGTMTPQAIFDAVVEANDEDDTEEDAGEVRGQMKLAPQTITPHLRFTFYVKHLPDAFGEHGLPQIDAQLDKYDKLAGSPLGFVTYLNSVFRDKKRTTKGRTEAFFGPEWFRDGIRACLVAAATAALCKGDNEGEQEAARIVELLTQCAELDIDAWLAIAGGKDSPLNKITLTKKTA